MMGYIYIYIYIYVCTCSFSYALYTCLDAGAGVYISVAMAMVYAYCLIFHAKTAAVATKARTTADNTVIEIHALSCASGNCNITYNIHFTCSPIQNKHTCMYVCMYVCTSVAKCEVHDWLKLIALKIIQSVCTCQLW